MMTTAHYFTLSRILLGPLFFVLYLYYPKFGIPFVVLPYVLIGIAILSEVSDLLDGLIARKKNQVTNLGKVLDPMADSIFRLSVFFSFTQGVIQLPLVLVLLFFYRDSVISTLRILCALKGVALAARMSGKIKAVIQAVCAFFILLLMIPYSLGYIELATLQDLSFYAALVTVVYTLCSGLEYIYANRTFIAKTL
jgi:CDP-diacylglycerol--glycerol-3-phosphate 3-phosphatidyltransferase